MNWWDEYPAVDDKSPLTGSDDSNAQINNWWDEYPAVDDAISPQGLTPQEQSSAGNADGSSFIDRARHKGLELLARKLAGSIESTQYATDRTRDMGLSLGQGIIMAPQAAVGILDIPTFGKTGKALESIGYKPDESIAVLEDLKSDRSKAIKGKFADADGVWEKAKVALVNPSLAIDTTIQSLPAMGMGGVFAKGLQGLGVASKTLSGALGEGLVSAGLQAEGIRSETEDGELTLKQSGLSALTGVTTALFGFGGGRLADKLGLPDPQTLAAGGRAVTVNVVRDNSITGASKRMVVNGIREGFFEELGQELTEQILSNIALGKPWTEGLDDAAVLAVMSGLITGGAVANAQTDAQFTDDFGMPPENKASAVSGDVGNLQTDSELIDAVNQSSIIEDNEGFDYEQQLNALHDVHQENADSNTPGAEGAEPMGRYDEDGRYHFDLSQSGLPFADEYALGLLEESNEAVDTSNTEQRQQMGLSPEMVAQHTSAKQDIRQEEATIPQQEDSAPTAQSEPVAQAAPPVQPKPKKRSPKDVNTQKDDILTAVAKMGGINTEEAKALGVATDDFNIRRGGVFPVFSKKGNGIDALGQRLADMGYLHVDEHGKIEPHALLNAVNEALRGRTTYTTEGAEYHAEREAERQALEAGDREALESLIPVDEDVPDAFAWERYMINQVMAAQEDAESSGVPLEWINWAVNQGGEDAAKTVKLLNALTIPFTDEDTNNVRAAEAATGIKRNSDAIDWLDEPESPTVSTRSRDERNQSEIGETASSQSSRTAKPVAPPDQTKQSTQAPKGAFFMPQGKTASEQEAALPDILNLSEHQYLNKMAKENGFEFNKDRYIKRVLKEQDVEQDKDKYASKSLKKLGIKPSDSNYNDKLNHFKEKHEAYLKDNVSSIEKEYEKERGRIEELYQEQFDEALAGLSFDEYNKFNPDTPESINRAAWEALRKAYNLPNTHKPKESKTPVSDKQVTAAAKEADTNPTDAQKEAGNYKKGHVAIQGLDISIENQRASKRTGVDENGKQWSVTMKHHYGYIKRTEGADGDHVDVFIGKKPDSKKVFIVDQINQKSGSFDEHKVMIGFEDHAQAVTAYKGNYNKGWKVGKVSSLSMDEFKQWLADGDTTKPFSAEVSFSKNSENEKQANLSVENEAQSKNAKGRTQETVIPDVGVVIHNGQSEIDISALPKDFMNDGNFGVVTTKSKDGKPIYVLGIPFNSDLSAHSLERQLGKDLPAAFIKQASEAIAKHEQQINTDTYQSSTSIEQSADNHSLLETKFYQRGKQAALQGYSIQPYERHKKGAHDYEQGWLAGKKQRNELLKDKSSVDVGGHKAIPDIVSRGGEWVVEWRSNGSGYGSYQEALAAMQRKANSAKEAEIMQPINEALDKDLSNAKKKGDETLIRKLRNKSFDADDAAEAAVKQGNYALFAEYEALFPRAAKAVKAVIARTADEAMAHEQNDIYADTENKRLSDVEYIKQNKAQLLSEIKSEVLNEIEKNNNRKARKALDVIGIRQRIAKKHGLKATGFDEADVVLGKALLPMLDISKPELERIKNIEPALNKAIAEQSAKNPNDFVTAPNGTIDFGEISPEVAKALGRQAGKIRLRQGDEKWGLTHIQTRHQEQIEKLGFESVQAFVSSVASNFTSIYKRDGTALDVVLESTGTGQRLVVQLVPFESGDFYDVKTASPIRSDQFKNKKPLWERIGTNTPVVDNNPSSPRGQSSAPSVAQKTNKKQTQSIESFGEEGLDLRREMDKEHSYNKDLTDQDIAAQPLSKIWPAKEIDAIEDIEKAAIATVIREAIPTKPKSSWKIERWVQGVKAARSVMQSLESADIEHIARLMRRNLANGDSLSNKAKLLSRIDRKQWSRIGEISIYPDAYRYEKDGTKTKAPQSSVMLDKSRVRFDGIVNIKELAEAIAAKLADKNAPTNANNAPTAQQFEIRQSRKTGKFFINRTVDKERTPLKHYDTVEQARAALKDEAQLQALADAWEAVKARENVTKADMRSTEERPRTGQDWRKGKNVSSEQFVKAFGLRHVDYGKWVSDKNGERQEMLNKAYDAFADLASILGIPNEAIGLNGKIIITLGKRGASKFAAHFEPNAQIINLTKTKGAGSLAHEWFHALDNHFARYRNASYSEKSRESAFITYKPEPIFKDKETGKVYKESTLNDLKNHYERYGESEKFNNDAFERIEGVRPVVEKVFTDLVSALDASPMKARSASIGNDYWSRIIERGARAFENYVIAKMDKDGYQNDFLVSVNRIEDFKRNPEKYPYLLDSELAPIEKAFDDLFSALETKVDDEGKTVLFSRSQDTQQAYEQRIDELFDGDKANNEGVVVLDRSDVLDMLGFGDMPLRMNEKHAFEDGRFNHPLTKEQWKKIPEWIENPQAVFERGKDGNLTLIAPETFNGNPLIIAIKPEASATKSFGEKRHLMLTAYVKDKGMLPLQAMMNEGEARYIDIKNSRKFNANSRVQFPSRGDELRGYGYKIHTGADLFKYRKNKNTVNQSRSSGDVRAARLNTAQVKQAVSEAIGERLVKSIGIVQSEADVPAGLIPIESDGVIEGMFDAKTNKIYLIADNLASTERAAWVAFHELFHRGIRNGDKDSRDYRQILERAQHNKMVERIAKAIMKEHGITNEMLAVEEALAELNAADETGNYEHIDQRYKVNIPNGFKEGIRRHIDRFMNFISRMLYRIGGKVYVSDAEIWQTLHATREGYHAKPIFDEQGKRINYGLASRSQQQTLNGLGEAPEETNFQTAQRLAQDNFNRFNVVQDWLKENGVNLSSAAHVYEAETRMSGRIAAQLEDFRDNVFTPLIRSMAKAGKSMNQLEDLLHAMHAKERNAYIASINKAFPDGGSGMANAEAQAILDQYAGDAVLHAFADRFRDISKQRLQMLVDEGIYSQADADAMQNAYTHYVPLKGGPDTENYNGSTGKGLTGKKDIKRALGHTTRESGESIVENIAVDFERAIMLVEKNRMAKHLLTLALEMNDPNMITVGKPEKRAVLQSKSSFAVWHKGSMVGSFSGKKEAQDFIYVNQSVIGNAIIQKTTDQSVVYTAMPQLAPNETVVFMNGQQIRIQLNDELLARAWNNLGQNSVIGMLKIAAGLNRWLSTVYTGYSPDFFVRNIVRDFSTGFVNVTGEEGFLTAARAVANYPSAIKQLVKYYSTGQATPMIQSYRDHGGKTGGSYISDLEKVGDDVKRTFLDAISLMEVYRKEGKRAMTASAFRRVFKPFFSYVEKVNAVSENAFRVATYQAMVREGRSPEDAAYRAKNVTVNFNKRGEWGASLNAYSLFYNASIQGAANYGHAMTKGKHKKQAWALSAGLMSLAYMMAQADFGGDDDDKDKLRDFELERSIPIRTSNGWFTIPLPYEMGFFWSLGRNLSDLVDGRLNTQEMAMKTAYSFASAYTVYGDVIKDGELDSKNLYALLPTFIQIPAGPVVNRNTFGSQIYPESTFNEDYPDNQKMYRNTKGSIFEMVTNGLNEISGGDAVSAGAISISPETLKYLNTALTGGAGRFIYDAMNVSAMLLQDVEMSDLDSREIPLARVLYKSETISDHRNKFAKRTEKAEKALGDFNRSKSVVKQLARYEGETDLELINKYGLEKAELIKLALHAEAIRNVAAEKRKAQAAVLAQKDKPLAARRALARKIEKEEQALYDGLFK